MAITETGYVYFTDDPDKKVFRRVDLQAEHGDDDSDFADPPNAKKQDWLTQGVTRPTALIAAPIGYLPEGVSFRIDGLSMSGLWPVNAPSTTNGIDANGNPWPPPPPPPDGG